MLGHCYYRWKHHRKALRLHRWSLTMFDSSVEEETHSESLNTHEVESEERRFRYLPHWGVNTCILVIANYPSQIWTCWLHNYNLISVLPFSLFLLGGVLLTWVLCFVLLVVVYNLSFIGLQKIWIKMSLSNKEMKWSDSRKKNRRACFPLCWSFE